MITDNAVDVNKTIRNFTQLATDTQQFLSILHRGGAWCFVQNLNAGETFDKRRSVYYRTNEPVTLPKAWYNDHANIFHGVNPIVIRREYFQASRNSDIAAIGSLYREYDAKDFAEPTQAEKDAQFEALRADPAKAKSTDAAKRNEALGNAKSAEFKRAPAHYLALAKAYVDSLTPAPSVVVFSGGGYQCYWLLVEPLVIRTHIDDQCAHIESYAADIQKRWVQLDPKADQGVHDLRRILRFLGSCNHKKKYAPNYPQVTFYQKRFDLRYSLQGLKALLPAPVVQQTATRIAQTAATATTAPTRTPYDGDSPIAAYNAKYTITALLEANGYSKVGDRYLRPGGTDSPGVEIDLSTNRSRHWSSNDPLYDPHWRSPFDVFCLFSYAGNVRAAVAAAAVELGMVRPPINVTATLDTLRLWIKTRNLATLLPAGKGSKKVRLVVDGIFDLMEANQRFVVTTGKKRLAGLAGVSANTVKNVLALVNDHIFDVTPTEYGDRITLVSNCRLMKFDPLLDVVKKRLTTGGQKTQNDKNEYSPHKADDAFASGMSRYMKGRMTTLAQVLDITYPQAKADYTFGGLGEGVLLARDTWQRVGDLTVQEYAEETGLRLGVARTHLHRAEKMGLAESEREGSRGPKVYSFIPEFWEKIVELSPNLRTYRLSAQRESKRIESAQQWCMKGIDEAKQVQNAEQAQQLERRFDKLAKERLPHLTRLHEGLSPDDIERLAHDVSAYKRSPQTEQAVRTERNAQRTEHRETVTLIRELATELADIDTPLESVFGEIMRFGVFEAGMVRSVLQSPKQMVRYETLEDIRQRAWAAV